MAKKVKKEEVTEEQVELVEEEVLEKEPTSEEVIVSLQEEIKALKNDLLKQHADLENTRKRLEKERIVERKYAAMNFAKNLLTPIDHFDMALKHVDSDEKVQQFAKGIEMIKNQFVKLLEDEGVSEIAALNEPYDPNFHQAIMTEKIEGTEPNIVVEILQTGYVFKDRLIRPAIVKISE
jgi:molecular chaperone GrpE